MHLILMMLAPLTAAHADDDPGFAPAWTEVTVDDYEFVTDEGEVLTPACSGLPGAESDDWSFWVRGGNPDKVVFFFEGGGMCIDPWTCLYAPTYVPQNNADAGFMNYVVKGIFEADNPDNPFADWTAVYLPFCTGDMHSGASDVEWPLWPGDPTAPTTTIRFRGHVNFRAALDYVSNAYGSEPPEEILVAGQSAGSYGAVVNMPYIADEFPDADVYVWGDSLTPSLDVGHYGNVNFYDTWNVQVHDSIFDVADVQAGNQDLLDVWSQTVAAYPDTRFFQTGRPWDGVLAFLGNWVFPHVNDVTMWAPQTFEDLSFTFWGANAETWDQLSTLSLYDNFRFYMVPGTGHMMAAFCIVDELGTPCGPEEETIYTAGANRDIALIDWLAEAVRDDGVCEDERSIWQNVGCEPGEPLCLDGPVPCVVPGVCGSQPAFDAVPPSCVDED